MSAFSSDVHIAHGGVQGDIPLVADCFSDGNRLILYRPSDGNFMIKSHGIDNWPVGDCHTIHSGFSHGVPLVANFFGDGQRLAVWEPSTGNFLVKGQGKHGWGESEGNVVMQCGMHGDIPLVANFFGDGVRCAVYRPANGIWYIKGHGKGNWGAGGETEVQCGWSGDIPFVADCFGDGNRLIVYRPADGHFYVKGHGPRSWADTPDNLVINMDGCANCKPFVANFFGDGPRLALFNTATGNWKIKGPGKSSFQESCGNVECNYGIPDDVPVVGQLGHGFHSMYHAGVFRPSEGVWHIKLFPKP